MKWIKLTNENKPDYGVEVLIRYCADTYYLTELEKSKIGDLFRDGVSKDTFRFELITHFCYITEPTEI